MDELTPTERHLIDEAVAAGRVRRIPPGVSAFALTWDEGRRSLRYVDSRFAIRAPRPSKEVVMRRKKVIEMLGRGMTVSEIAKRHGVSVNTIHSDLRALRANAQKDRSRK